nr:MAG TPA: hypothetical protein [Caudoviricetes sp.]
MLYLLPQLPLLFLLQVMCRGQPVLPVDQTGRVWYQ